MKKCNVYTRQGDDGLTSLASGQRISKASLRLESYGTVDELNSQLGLLLTYISAPSDRQVLIEIQRHLFSVGCLLATDNSSVAPASCQISDEDIVWLEHSIDVANDGLPGWRGFTLPGGCRAAAVAHVCRTVCRRAERVVYALKAQENVDEHVTIYLNRLSDYLYVMACRLNFLSGETEILWRKSL